MFREQFIKDRGRNINRLHREINIYFPEYIETFVFLLDIQFSNHQHFPNFLESRYIIVCHVLTKICEIPLDI